MPNKIVFKVHKTTPIRGVHLRLSEEMRCNINYLMTATGLPASRIVADVLQFAVENFEVEEY